MKKIVCLLLISVKDYLKIYDQDGFSFSISCPVRELFVFYNIRNIAPARKSGFDWLV